MKKNKKITILTALLASIVAIILNLYSPEDISFDASTGENTLAVHFLDVGQADSTLLISGEEAMLIDAGEKSASSYIIDYIKNLGVEKLSYVIATHPHSDHIGGIADVIREIPADSILMPDVTHTTATFEKLLDTIEQLNVEITVPNKGDTFYLGGTQLKILSPENGSYDDLNNYSIVVKAINGNTSFLFMGDAESVVERELIEQEGDLKSTVLKIGHHGSNSSSTLKFLQAVAPTYGVISCGLNNDYNHPSKDVIKRLESLGIILLGTYEQGTISAVSDGNSVTFSEDSIRSGE